MKSLNFKKNSKIHFIGVAGIGMSAVAQYFLSEGHRVSGSDLEVSPVTELLEKKGVQIFIEQRPENISSDIDLVVYSLAVGPENPEFKKAQEFGIKIISYPEALGLISKDKYTIAVSGSHGKTTTTAMIAKIMIDAGLSPSVIAGSLMSEYKSNFVSGRSDYFLVEACEYKRSFLELNPNILVITNIEAEHLDYYKDLGDVQSAFWKMAKKLGKEDFLVCNINDRNLQPIITSKEIECNIVDYYSLGSPGFKLRVPGRHNEENAKAALSVAAIFSIAGEKAAKSLEDFQGTWRRLESKGKTAKGALVFDDYAHHPTEIKATLSSLKEMFPDKKIVVVFQPHLYSRTKILLKDFAGSFAGASEVIVAPIYAAREEIDPEIDSGMLAKEIGETGLKSSSLGSFEEIIEYLKINFDSRHIIATMGAGDVYKIAEEI